MEARMTVQDVYEKITKKYNVKESFKVVKKVDEYRQSWKPNKVRIVLLAESHKYTKESMLSNKANYSHLNDKYSKLLKKYPQEYVKFVYCLGYGENDLFRKPISENKGTWQFWRIFYSCMNKVSTNSDLEENSVLKKVTKSFEERLKNKVNLLCKLKDRGIWLVDASIVGIDGKNHSANKDEIIKMSWEHYIKGLLLSLPSLKHIIIIGKRVEKCIKKDIKGDKLVSIPFTRIYQPQGCREKGMFLKELKKVSQICKKYT